MVTQKCSYSAGDCLKENHTTVSLYIGTPIWKCLPSKRVCFLASWWIYASIFDTFSSFFLVSSSFYSQNNFCFQKSKHFDFLSVRRLLKKQLSTYCCRLDCKKNKNKNWKINELKTFSNESQTDPPSVNQKITGFFFRHIFSATSSYELHGFKNTPPAKKKYPESCSATLSYVAGCSWG